MTQVPGVAYPARAIVDLDAIRDNTAELKRRAGGADVMAVVKANAYGHGLVPCARAALAGGATWLAVAELAEALRLRAGLDARLGSELGEGLGEVLRLGSDPPSDRQLGESPTARSERRAGVAASRVPIFSWIYPGRADLGPALEAGIDLGVSTLGALESVAAAAHRTGTQARVHLKIDTGLGRAGATAVQWEELVDGAARLQASGAVDAIGCWSHFACADQPGHPSIRAQEEAFAWAVTAAAARGLRFEVRHQANSAALLTGVAGGLELVRPGLALYGMSPIPDTFGPAELGLRAAMRLESELCLVKPVGAGQGVSYGHTYVTAQDTILGVVPMGYADGVSRLASSAAPVWVGGRRTTVAGRVCMDQFVLDLGPAASDRPGDRVVLFGDAAEAVPTAQDWAEACQTINYEITTRLPNHLPRVYVGRAGL